MDDSEEEGDDAIRKDNVVSAHKMGRDDLMRSNEIRDNLMRSDKADDNLVRSEEEEVEDVMSCLFEWDFDQLLRQAENSGTSILGTKNFGGPLASKPQSKRGNLGFDFQLSECRNLAFL